MFKSVRTKFIALVVGLLVLSQAATVAFLSAYLPDKQLQQTQAAARSPTGIMRSYRPFPCRTRRVRRSKSTSKTPRRMSSARRMPVA